MRNKFLFFFSCLLLTSGSSVADDSVLDGKDSREFRIHSAATLEKCLKCKLQKGVVGQYNQKRVVLSWGKECKAADSAFSYVNMGDHEAFTCKEYDVSPGFLNRPGIDPLAPYKAEQLFVANTINDDELRGSMIVDLLKNADGTYSLASFDKESEEEGAKSPPFCMSDENASLPSLSGSARVVKHGEMRSECARLLLIDVKPAAAAKAAGAESDKKTTQSGR